MGTANSELSKRLSEVLESIGASEYERRLYWEFGMLSEIAGTAQLKYDPAGIKRTIYHVGSTREGITTPGMGSDVDMIFCYDAMHVIENILDAQQQGISYLIITDELTNPGYVRLQKEKDKCPLSIGKCKIPEISMYTIDHKGNMCIPHLKLIYGLVDIRNGPADTTLATKAAYQHDIVCALRFRHIPRLYQSWSHRKRKYGWPSQKQLRAMRSYGCFLVGVGYPQCNYKSIEWRLSFSLQERDLMLSLNETQHKCYILLKMIKKDIIVSKIGESISSYHCKTSLFYTIENSPRHVWVASNLILCAGLCLICMLNWAKANYCPNYFIPEENMFDKLSPIALNSIKTILIDIIESDVNFLYTLTCANVGALLQSKMCGSELLHSLVYTRSPILLACDLIAHLVFACRNMYLEQLTQTGYMNGVLQLLLYLQNTNHVTEHTTREVRMALDSIIPHIQLQHKQCMYAQYVSRLSKKTFQKFISESSSDYDLISSKLALASLYFQFEQHQEECQCILVSCESSLEQCGEQNILSVCACHNYCLDRALAKKLRFTEISCKYFQRQYTTGCMLFHFSQVALLHQALQYELFRTVYTDPETEIPMGDYNWLNWVTIDSKVYLYFLQYLIYSKTQQMSEKETAFLKLMQVLITDCNLGHTETGFNVLGWICLQDNDIRAAWQMFCLSWKVRPFRNAAKWHMLILINRKIHRETPFI